MLDLLILFVVSSVTICADSKLLGPGIMHILRVQVVRLSTEVLARLTGGERSSLGYPHP